MCFSATASFTVGTVLLTIGVMALKRVTASSQIVLACIPLLFAIQQFAEGFVWLSLTNKIYEATGPPATTVFLIFAQVLWPIIVPVAMYFVEKENKRKKVLAYLVGIGIVVGFYLACCLLFYNYTADINSFHIHYSLQFPLVLSPFSGIAYIIPTVLPNFISSANRRISLLGITIVASYFFTKIFYENYFISVWCFFAAIISALILSVIISMKQPFERKPDMRLLAGAVNKLT